MRGRERERAREVLCFALAIVETMSSSPSLTFFVFVVVSVDMRTLVSACGLADSIRDGSLFSPIPRHLDRGHCSSSGGRKARRHGPEKITRMEDAAVVSAHEPLRAIPCSMLDFVQFFL